MTTDLSSTMTSTSLINHFQLTSNSTSPMVLNTTLTRKPFFIQGQEMIQHSFQKFSDRTTLTNATIVIVSITCLILIFISVKTLILRKRRQNRRYKLLSHATRMEEPLFNGNNDEEEEEREDDTLFIRK